MLRQQLILTFHYSALCDKLVQSFDRSNFISGRSTREHTVNINKANRR